MFPSSCFGSPSLQAKEDAEKEHVKAMLALQVKTLKSLCLLLHMFILVLFQPAQPLTATAPIIDIEDTILENVVHFGYHSKSANINVKIQHGIRCACFAYSRLKYCVFTERGFRTATKILVYKAVILTTLLHDRETRVA